MCVLFDSRGRLRCCLFSTEVIPCVVVILRSQSTRTVLFSTPGRGGYLIQETVCIAFAAYDRIPFFLLVDGSGQFGQLPWEARPNWGPEGYCDLRTVSEAMEAPLADIYNSGRWRHRWRHR